MKKFITILLFIAVAVGVGVAVKKMIFVRSFVSLNEDNKFELEGEEFYPIAINYSASLHTDGNHFWVGPHFSYNHNNVFDNNNRDSCIAKFRSDMKRIKAMGFNSLRIVKVGEEWVHQERKGEVFVRTYVASDGLNSIVLNEKTGTYQKYFNALEEMLSIVDEAGLKAILLVRMRPHSDYTANHVKKLAARFKDNSTIMAYDLLNEPLYFDSIARSKESVVYELNMWNDAVKKNAKRHLTTIGLAGIREVFEWDPSMLNLDFITFHPYEYEPEQVRNEIYWYGKYVKKPWMIGETAIPADNDSITYEDQKLFAKNTLKQTINCGGLGYAWWQYKEVIEPKYHATYMGVVDLGEKEKPVADAFREFVPEVDDTCLCFENYYNYSDCDSFALKGRVVDEHNNPIQGAVILGWNKHWSHSYHSVTKKDGTYELQGCYTFYYWMISASEYTMNRGKVYPDSLTINNLDERPFVDLGTTKLERMHIHEN